VALLHSDATGALIGSASDGRSHRIVGIGTPGWEARRPTHSH
jgi:hypothetical protein